MACGWGGIHIDAGALHVDELVQDIRETDAGVVVSLTPDAAQKAGIGQDIEIELESKVPDGVPLVMRFEGSRIDCRDGISMRKRKKGHLNEQAAQV